MAPARPEAAGRPARSSRRVVPHQLSWPKRCLARLAYWLIRGVAATLRFRYEDSSGLFNSEMPRGVIIAIWHNRLALSLVLYIRYVQRRQPSRRMAAIVSASRDGAVVARLLELFGAQPVRGSTSRRGPQALLELTSWAERGFDLAITPDGPRGPCYLVQEGVIALAQLTGLPIAPASYHVNWRLRLKSWDRFLIPLPFARVTMSIGQPVQVPREATEEEREQCRRVLEERLRACTRD